MNNENTAPEPRIVPAYQLLLAGAIGAFFVAFGDILNNEQAGTVAKIAEVMRVQLGLNFAQGLLIPLLIITVLGMLLCWARQSGIRNHIDAFIIGSAIFAFLGFATSQPEHADPADRAAGNTSAARESLSLVATAWAEEPRVIAVAPIGTVVITVQASTADATVEQMTITARDPESARIFTTHQVQGNRLTLQKPIGDYLLEIESPGFKRTTTRVTLTEEVKEYSLTMEATRVSLRLQRLVMPQTVELKQKENIG